MGFAVLAIIDIPVIRDMVISLSIGIFILVFTNLVLLPVMLSYTGASKTGAERSLSAQSSRHPLFHLLEKFTEPKPAMLAIVFFAGLFVVAMVVLGIGIKVATLPVIALGVGIGVDYALYLLSIQLANQRNGDSLAVAYAKALRFTGKIVGLIGLTLAAGVCTWVFSPIKFQADMGILLTFMFLWNMIGALILIPALSWFLMHKPGHV